MLAMSVMSAGATAFFYVLAFVALFIAALISYLTSDNGFKSGALWLCVGLALFVLVFAYNALALA